MKRIFPFSLFFFLIIVNDFILFLGKLLLSIILFTGGAASFFGVALGLYTLSAHLGCLTEWLYNPQSVCPENNSARAFSILFISLAGYAILGYINNVTKNRSMRHLNIKSILRNLFLSDIFLAPFALVVSIIAIPFTLLTVGGVIMLVRQVLCSFNSQTVCLENGFSGAFRTLFISLTVSLACLWILKKISAYLGWDRE